MKVTAHMLLVGRAANKQRVSSNRIEKYRKRQ